MIIRNCPTCGHELTDQTPAMTPQQLGYAQPPRTMAMTMATGDILNIDGFRSWTKTEPAVRPGTNAHVWVSFGQAFFSGLFSGVVAIFTAVHWSWPWYSPLAIWSVVSFFTWFISQDFYRRQMMKTETIEVDAPPLPPPPPVEHTIRLIDPATKKTSFIKINITDDQMSDVATAVLLPGGTFSRGYLCNGRKILTQPEYRELRQIMLQNHLLRELPNKSNELTASGRHVLNFYKEL